MTRKENFMKRVISIFLLLSFAFSFAACTAPESAKDVSCEDIIAAYAAAGYTLGHHLHEDPVYLEDGICCSLLFKDPQDPDKNYIYIERYTTTNGAYLATGEGEYNPILWFVSALHGEGRWLRSEQFGTLHCTTFEKKMLMPLQSIVE